MAKNQTTPEQHSVRLLKVGEQVRHVISEILAKPLLGEHEEEVLKALRTNTAYFQREVAQRLKLKFAAKIQFRSDQTFDEASRIDALLNDPRVKRDLEG
jgi:ribosome-binding factor A